MGHNDGRHDFDFFFGAWRIANRKRVNMVVPGDDEWVEFEATSEARPILGGLGNVDTYSAPDFPGRPGFEALHAAAVRAEDRRSGGSGGRPRSATRRVLDEPVVGRFEEDGIGRFECDDIVEGIHVRVRYEWTVIDDDTLKWEQFFSFDGRRTWESNWVMDSTRIAARRPSGPTPRWRRRFRDDPRSDPPLPLERQLVVARPLVPRAGVVPGPVAGRPERHRGDGRARARVAVRDDLRALGQADERADLLRRQRHARRREELARLEVPRARDVALARVARIAALAA